MAWVQYNSIKLQITIGSFQQVIQNKIVLEFHLYLFRLERSSWECSAKIANQLIQEVWAADSATCRTTPNTGTVQGSSSALLQCYRCINHNPLISYSSRQLSVCLQASCSIFIKGASLLEKPRTLPFNLFLWFFFLMFCSTVSTSNTQNTGRVALVLQKRAMCTRGEMKKVSETVYKNGTFIATERSCTWLHRVTTDGNRSRPSWAVGLLKEVRHTTCLDTSTNQKYTKNMKKLRHSATHWKQGVTVYLFF